MMSPDRFYRMKQLREHLNIPAPTLYQWVREGRFPKPVQLGPKVIAWQGEVINAWLSEKINSSEKVA